MLQFSLQHRITYWLRTCTPSETIEMARHVDCCIMETNTVGNMRELRDRDDGEGETKVTNEDEGWRYQEVYGLQVPNIPGGTARHLADRDVWTGRSEMGKSRRVPTPTSLRRWWEQERSTRRATGIPSS